MALCRRCAEKWTESPRWSREAGRPGTPVCAYCGAVIGSREPVDKMLVKLSELSRLGLGADDRPLLAHADRDDT